MNSDDNMRSKTRSLPLSDGEIYLRPTKNGHVVITYQKGEATYKGIGTVASHVNDEALAIEFEIASP